MDQQVNRGISKSSDGMTTDGSCASYLMQCYLFNFEIRSKGTPADNRLPRINPQARFYAVIKTRACRLRIR